VKTPIGNLLFKQPLHFTPFTPAGKTDLLSLRYAAKYRRLNKVRQTVPIAAACTGSVDRKVGLARHSARFYPAAPFDCFWRHRRGEIEEQTTCSVISARRTMGAGRVIGPPGSLCSMPHKYAQALKQPELARCAAEAATATRQASVLRRATRSGLAQRLREQIHSSEYHADLAHARRFSWVLVSAAAAAMDQL
jgi:hypothetical protein